MRTKLCPKIQVGDLIDIVAPGSGTQAKLVELAAIKATEMGFKVRVPKKLLSAHPYHANEDQMRYELLEKALLAKDSKMVWCLRGGYGANRIIPNLLKLRKPTASKLVVGYSDVTSLHLFLNLKWNWSSMHGPLFETLTSDKHSASDWNDFWASVSGKNKNASYKITPMNALALKRKTIQGKLLGGNLCTLQSAIGTSLKLDFSNSILFLEDIGERGYRVDRMLTHLAQSGVLKKTKAIVFADFIGGDESNKENYVDFALSRFANDIKLPVFKGLEVGHGKMNKPIFLNTQAKIEVSRISKLTVNSGLLDE